MTQQGPAPLVGLALAATAFLSGCGAGDDPASPENLLFVCVDTLRADYLGAFGGEPSVSPFIDELADSGIVFEHAVSHASWTLPSFAAILTSLYTSTHGCENRESRLSDSYVTLPEIFGDAGFDTQGIASHVFFNDDYGLQQGFDAFDDELAHKKGDDGWTPITSPLITQKAVEWLDARAAADGRWLLWLHYFDPHYPYLNHPPGGEAGVQEEERYRGEIAFTDGHVGAVLEALERNGFAENTVVVFVSDHGEAFEEHPGVKRHAKSLHREELRVPLIVRVPGLAARRVEELVRTVDLYPTLLELFRLEAPVPVEGVSLVPAMTGRSHESPPLLSEIRLHEGYFANGLVDGRWKLIEDTSLGVTRLFDLEQDLLETRDLAAERPDVVERLRAEMQSRMERARVMGEVYEAGGTVELDADTLRHLQDLGY